mgnify:CR=1 FL=1
MQFSIFIVWDKLFHDDVALIFDYFIILEDGVFKFHSIVICHVPLDYLDIWELNYKVDGFLGLVVGVYEFKGTILTFLVYWEILFACFISLV